MGNRHNKQGCFIHHHLHKYEEHQQKQQQQEREVTSRSGSCRSMLPILCSNSINDIVLPVPSTNLEHQNKAYNQEEEDICSSIITNLQEDPLSPKVSCMGQLNNNKNHNHNNKRRSNRVSAIPKQQHLHKNNNTTCTLKQPSNAKLRKLFSGKNLLFFSTTTTTSIKTTTGGGFRSNSCVGPRSTTNNSTQQQQQLSFIREMDPPLPVVLTTNNKPQQQDNKDGEEGTHRSSIIWKRRFGDVSSLKTLDINTTYSRPPQPLLTV